MENRKIVCVAALFLSGMLQAGITTAETYSGVGTDVGVSTGQAGTTSGITGSDMSVEDETTGEGQAYADQIHRVGQAEPASAADQPEEEAPPSATGSSGSNQDKQGTPQASSPNYSGDGNRQSEGQQ